MRAAIGKLFEHFVGKQARACAISLPPDFAPQAGLGRRARMRRLAQSDRQLGRAHERWPRTIGKPRPISSSGRSPSTAPNIACRSI